MAADRTPAAARASELPDESRYEPVTLDGATFAELVGRENRDVFLFRVSDAWIEAMGDNRWHGPVEWRVVREEGRIVTLEMREVRLVV